MFEWMNEYDQSEALNEYSFMTIHEYSSIWLVWINVDHHVIPTPTRFPLLRLSLCRFKSLYVNNHESIKYTYYEKWILVMYTYTKLFRLSEQHLKSS
jgi:hypothetical protein